MTDGRPDEREGALRALVQSVKHSIALSRDNADVWGRTTRAYRSKQAGVTALPDDVLREYEQALRAESAKIDALADAIRDELASR